jgi:DNA-binding NarL/FixJ family response regulator
MCRRQDYDLILCDVMTPNLPGAGVHQRLSSLMARMASRVLEKPVDRNLLAEVIASVQPLACPAG